MKIILLRSKGAHRSLHLSRGKLAAICAGFLLLGAGVVGALVHTLPAQGIDPEVVEQWRSKLGTQREELLALSRKNDAQSMAVGRQLADMRARLLRMEAIGAHMTEVADLDNGEFNFDEPPAQGGPVAANFEPLGWDDLSVELTQLSGQIRRRETELGILEQVLATEDIGIAAKVSGRPVTWGWMSSPFGNRVDPITGKPGWHSGVDFAGRDGSDVVAVASGVVTFAGRRSGYGNLVEISHADGLVTRYAHQKSLSVSVGDVVKKGARLGAMGSSGRSTGPHVHFEVLKNGRPVDPASYVARKS